MLRKHLDIDRRLELDLVALLELLVGLLEQGDQVRLQDLVVSLGQLENELATFEHAVLPVHVLEKLPRIEYIDIVGILFP